MNYVLMRKVFAAKEQITRTTDLTGLAYNYQFADLPHFSHTFKKYVGVSPNDFKKQQR
jgi:AraC-like DNA-binding protein